jgi:hypothetical protein
VTGVLAWEIHDLGGNLLDSGEAGNLVVNTGLDLLRDCVGGDFHKAPTHLWLGTNATAAAAGDTTATITGPYKKAITARVRGTRNVSFQTFVGSTEGNGVTYNEAGLVTTFNAIDTLFARVAITPIPKTAAVTVTFTWVITVGAV